VTKTGTVSEPGPESEPVFLGTPLEDEVFGLPGNNYPKETSGGRLVHFGSCRNSKHFGSYSNLDFPSGNLNIPCVSGNVKVSDVSGILTSLV